MEEGINVKKKNVRFNIYYGEEIIQYAICVTAPCPDGVAGGMLRSHISVYTVYNTGTFYGSNTNIYSKSKTIRADTAKVDRCPGGW
jgi:hypothetical protein